VIGVIFFPLTIETIQYVVGVKIACRGEVLVGVPLYAFTQFEGVNGAIVGNRPGLGQAGNNLGRTGLELGEAVVDGLRGCIEVCTSGMQARIKSSRATL